MRLFADQLRQWRSKKNRKQQEAADFLKVPLRTYQEWEQGRQEPAQLGPIRELIRRDMEKKA